MSQFEDDGLCSRCEQAKEPLVAASSICTACGPEPVCPDCVKLHLAENREQGNWWPGSGKPR